MFILIYFLLLIKKCVIIWCSLKSMVLGSTPFFTTRTETGRLHDQTEYLQRKGKEKQSSSGWKSERLNQWWSWSSLGGLLKPVKQESSEDERDIVYRRRVKEIRDLTPWCCSRNVNWMKMFCCVYVTSWLSFCQCLRGMKGHERP